MSQLPSYTTIKKIASGGSAEVFLGVFDDAERTPICIKIMLLKYYFAARDEYIVYQYIMALGVGTDDHPGRKHIVTILDQHDSSIVMEYMDGNLLDLMNNIPQYHKGLPALELCELTRQVSYALSLLHIRKVVHADLKPENILYKRLPSGEIVYKLIDFGNSLRIGIDPFPMKIQTREYRCYETLTGSSALSTASDLPSLACIVFEMATNDYLFPGKMTEDDHAAAICNMVGQHHLQLPDLAKPVSDSDYITPLLLKWLHPCPEQRGTIDEALATDPWLTTMHATAVVDVEGEVEGQEWEILSDSEPDQNPNEFDRSDVLTTTTMHATAVVDVEGQEWEILSDSEPD